MLYQNQYTIVQKILSEEDCILQIEVRPNKEFESVVFSYFPDVVVVQPEWLRDEFQKKIKDNLKKYSSVKNGRIDNSVLCTVKHKDDK